MSVYFVMLAKIILCIANFQFLVHFTSAFDPKAFDDSIHYKFHWLGDGLADSLEEKAVLVSTDIQEKFKCVLPESEESSNQDVEQYTGATPLELLQPLFKITRCSYKLGSYWTYEICHGLHVRQYHEDREMKTPKGQEYSLGQWDEDAMKRLKEELEELDEKGERKYLSTKLPVVKIENLKLPYLRINMTGGTFCELSKKPRVTYVQYVCYKHGKHEVYSFKEIATCEYETVVLSPLLCSHPMFKPLVTNEQSISCYSMPGAAPKPRALYELEQESAKLRQNRVVEESKREKTVAVFSIKEDEDGKRKVHVELIPVDSVDSEEADKLRHLNQLNQKAMSPIDDFLAGRECLYGGSTWWKFEFCFGRYVRQYHEEKDESRITVLLGSFNEEAHRAWINENVFRKAAAMEPRKFVTHLYTGGDTCDKTGSPRKTEVVLKCIESNPNSGSVSLSLTEPKTCEYVLTVESSLLCEYVARVDKDGINVKNPRIDEADFDLTVEVEEVHDFDVGDRAVEGAPPGGAAGPPVPGFASTVQDKYAERVVKDDSTRVEFSSERKQASGTVNIPEETSAESDSSKSRPSPERGDRGSSSESKSAAGRREGRTLLKDEL